MSRLYHEKGYVPPALDRQVLRAARMFALFRQDLEANRLVYAGQTLRSLQTHMGKYPNIREIGRTICEGSTDDALQRFMHAGVFIDPTDWQINPIIARNVLRVEGVNDVVIVNPSGALTYFGIFFKPDQEPMPYVVLNASGAEQRLKGLLEIADLELGRQTLGNLVTPQKAMKAIIEHAQNRKDPFDFAVKKALYYLFCRWVLEQKELYGQDTMHHMVDMLTRTSAVHELGHAFLFKAGCSDYANLVDEERRAYLVEMAFGNPLFALLDTWGMRGPHQSALLRILENVLAQFDITAQVASLYPLLRVRLDALSEVAKMMLEEDLRRSFGRSIDEIHDVPELERVFNARRIITAPLFKDVCMTPEI